MDNSNYISKSDSNHISFLLGTSSAASTTSIMTSMASNNPTSTSSVISSQQIVVGGPQSHSYPPRQSYVNYPSGQDNGNNEPIYVPGSYLVSQVLMSVSLMLL